MRSRGPYFERFFTCTTNTEYATMPCPGLREGLKSMPSYKMLWIMKDYLTYSQQMSVYVPKQVS